MTWRYCSSHGKKTLDDSANSPIGMLERKPKKEGGLETQPCSTPFEPFPENKNPKTGEVGGPSGPEPTRFGDWERKGRVSDF